MYKGSGLPGAGFTSAVNERTMREGQQHSPPVPVYNAVYIDEEIRDDH